MNKKFSAASIFLGQYVNKKKLGKGAFGDVFLVENSKGEQFALKIIDIQKMSGQNEEMLQYLKGEIQVMKFMNYPNIVKLYDFKQDEEFYYMVLEYCDGGDLINLQATLPNKVFTLDMAADYLSQVILGLQSLHKNKYLHRDIKLQNVLLKKQNGQKIFKIADFGFAKKASNLSGTVLGTEQYMSPQIYRCGIETNGQANEDLYGYQVDMWAFGVLLYYMLNMAFPFELSPYWSLQEKYKELTKQATDFSYRKSVQTTRKKIKQNCTQQVEDLFHKIFNVNVDKRITFSEIRQHPVFAPYFPNISVESRILYTTKFVSSIKKKGRGDLVNNLTAKKAQLQEKRRIGLSSISYVQEEKFYPQEKEVIRLEIEEICFLWNMVEQIELVEKSIGFAKSIMFAYNMIKYYIILLSQYIRGLKATNYNKRLTHLKWIAYFETDEFAAQRKEVALKKSKAEHKFDQIYKRCCYEIKQISKLNEHFKSAFFEYVDDTATFDGDFFRSFRKSTDILYTTLKQFLKTNKIKEFYFYLCMVCICHVYNQFYEDPELKKKIFSVYLSQQTEQTVIFSYQHFVYYLKNCGKDALIKLTKRLIEECMT